MRINKHFVFICLVIVLTICVIVLGFMIKYVRDEKHALLDTVAMLETAQEKLQAEKSTMEKYILSLQNDNEVLTNIIASTQQEDFTAMDTADALDATDTAEKVETTETVETAETAETVNSNEIFTQENSVIDAIFHANPIDDYFIKKAQKMVPTTTNDMVQYELICASAWKDEMENCYAILMDKTQNALVREWLEHDRYIYEEYIKNHAEIAILFGSSNAFSGDDENLTTGTITRILRVSKWTEGYKNKTMELFYYLYDIDSTPPFVFSADKFDTVLQQTFPALWDKSLE